MGIIDSLGCARPAPVLILTGGDCLQRPDLLELAAYAKSRGVPVAVSPSVSPSLERGVLEALRDNGVGTASLSLDGSNPTTHDRIRQVPGHFAETVAAVDLLHERGFEVQINTAVMAQNVHELADIASLLADKGVRTWEVFFLVGVGRGETVAEIAADEYEDVCHFLVDAARYNMVVRTVEAPFFRRVCDWRAKAAPGADPAGMFHLGPLYGELAGRLVDLLGDGALRGPRAKLRDPRRQGHNLCRPRRPGLPGRVLALVARICPTGPGHRHLSRPRPVEGDPASRVPGSLRPLRIRPAVRRLEGACLRLERRPPRRRPGLLVCPPKGDTQ